MKDLILGAFTDYDYPQIQYWVNSIKQSEFDGDIALFVGRATFDTVDKLIDKGVMVVCCEKNEEHRMWDYKSNMPIHTERFFHFFNILKDNAYRYDHVIITDVKDVIFQTNPSDWLINKLDDKQLVAATECIKYKDEAWGNMNLEQTFGPYFHEYFKHNEIYNVGVLAGKAEYMRDFCLNLFLMCTNRSIPICDQSCYNVMLYSMKHAGHIQFTEMSDGWCCNLGTVGDPLKIDKFRPFLTEPEPEFRNGRFFPHGRIDPFVVVHQWDRLDSAHVSYIKQIYGDNK